jgi:hypothetical protein
VVQALLRGPFVDDSPHSLERLKDACRPKGLRGGTTSVLQARLELEAVAADAAQ